MDFKFWGCEWYWTSSETCLCVRLQEQLLLLYIIAYHDSSFGINFPVLKQGSYSVCTISYKVICYICYFLCDTKNKVYCSSGLWLLKCHILGLFVAWNVKLLFFALIMVKHGVSTPWRLVKKLSMKCSMRVLKEKVSEKVEMPSYIL